MLKIAMAEKPRFDQINMIPLFETLLVHNHPIAFVLALAKRSKMSNPPSFIDRVNQLAMNTNVDALRESCVFNTVSHGAIGITIIDYP
jgi:hypothetical protein